MAAAYLSRDGFPLRGSRPIWGLGTARQSWSRLGRPGTIRCLRREAKLVCAGTPGSSRGLGVNGGRNRTCLRLADWLEVALDVARQCIASSLVRSCNDDGTRAQGAAGLLGLHCGGCSISSLRCPANFSSLLMLAVAAGKHLPRYKSDERQV